MKEVTRYLLSFIFGLALASSSQGQATVWFQGFENTSLTCTENWNYTGGQRNSQTDRTGSWSGMVGRSGTSGVMTFSTLDVSGLTGLQLELYHSVRTGAGPGMDVREGAVVQVRVDGGLWQNIAQIGGSSDHSYDWTAATGGAPFVSSGCNVYQAPNPINYSIPGGTTSFALRILSVSNGSCAGFNNDMNNGNASLYNRTDEGFHVDDIRITTTLASLPCIWTGNDDTDWHNCLNWKYFNVPTASDDVQINQSGNVFVNCEVTSADASCNNITVTTANSNNQDLKVINGRTLDVLGDMVISRTGNGTGSLSAEAVNGGVINVTGEFSATIDAAISLSAQVLILAQNGGVWNISGNASLINNSASASPYLWIVMFGPAAATFRCNDLTIDGSPANPNSAFLDVFTDSNHLIDINGDFTMTENARFDLSGTATTGVFFGGDYSNQVSEAQFVETNCELVFDGSGVQDVSTAGFTEFFHDVTLNKTGGYVRLQNGVQLDNLGVLSLNNDQIDLNGNVLTILNPSPTAIATATGSIVDESGSAAGNNTGRVNWAIGSNPASHVFPMADGIGGTDIPFTFDLISGNAGTVSLSSYGTPPDNLPWPLTPDPVSNLNSVIGLTPDNRDATVDRFWQVDVSGSAAADITFSYAPSELPVAPYNDPSDLRAQRYDVSTDEWQPATNPQTVLGNSVTVENVTTFSPWTLASRVAPLPVEWLDFTAREQNGGVMLNWSTASETNCSHYDVQRSKDAIHFHTVAMVQGKGNTSTLSLYEWFDENPLKGVSYYRLEQHDFNGDSDHSNIEAIDMSGAGYQLIYSAGQIQLQTPCNSSVDVVLRDAAGRIVLSLKNNNSQRISLRHLPAGLYILKATCGQTVFSDKIVVQ